MKIKIGFTIFILLVVIFAFILINDNRKGVDQTYILPLNYEGCVIIYYDIENAPPLEMVDNMITYEVPEDGIIKTSSPMEFGWVSRNHSGSYQLHAFYIDKNGNKVRELTHDEMPFGATGSMESEEKVQHYYMQFFGPDGIENKGCSAAEF